MQIIKAVVCIVGAMAVSTHGKRLGQGNKTKVFQERFCVESTPEHLPSETELAQFDAAVRVSGSFVRECEHCEDSHKTIVYRRLTKLPELQSFGDLAFKTWSSENNILGTDFELYGSVTDAKKQKNAWEFCNYDDPNVGFPRDCGAQGEVPFQWNAVAAPEGLNTVGTHVRFCTLL